MPIYGIWRLLFTLFLPISEDFFPDPDFFSWLLILAPITMTPSPPHKKENKYNPIK